MSEDEAIDVLMVACRAERWIGRTGLHSARRGQEFVCDIGRAREPRRWLGEIVRRIESRVSP